jgi:hypothetical protein
MLLTFTQTEDGTSDAQTATAPPQGVFVSGFAADSGYVVIEAQPPGSSVWFPVLQPFQFGPGRNAPGLINGVGEIGGIPAGSSIRIKRLSGGSLATTTVEIV